MGGGEYMYGVGMDFHLGERVVELRLWMVMVTSLCEVGVF